MEVVKHTPTTKEEIAQLIELNRTALYKHAFHLCGRREADAEDVLQESISKMLTFHEKYIKQDVNFKAWACTVVYNNFINILRKNKKHETSDIHEFSSCFFRTNEDISGQAEIREVINKTINKVWGIEREYLILRLQGYSFDEIAYLYNLRVSQLKPLTSNALHFVKQDIAKQLGIKFTEELAIGYKGKRHPFKVGTTKSKPSQFTLTDECDIFSPEVFHKIVATITVSPQGPPPKQKVSKSTYFKEKKPRKN